VERRAKYPSQFYEFSLIKNGDILLTFLFSFWEIKNQGVKEHRGETTKPSDYRCAA